MDRRAKIVINLIYKTEAENICNFETEGMGLKHYFYRTDNILIWWQVEPDYAETTYNDLLKFDFKGLNNRVTP
jgi:hypothetical protein